MSKTEQRRKTWRAALLAIMTGAPMVIAGVPRSSKIANDTAIYQNLHEINLKKVKTVNFDSDISRLSAQEKSHHESLPVRISGPMDRIQKSKYRSRK